MSDKSDLIDVLDKGNALITAAASPNSLRSARSITRLSDEWKEYVADAIALKPGQRSETMRAEIKWAMENDR